MGVSSIPILIGDEFLIAGSVISLVVFLYRRLTFDKFIFQYAVFYLLIFILQSFVFSVLEINVIVGYIVRIFYAYFTLKIIGKNIIKYYVNIIYVFTLISFVFYFPTIFLGDVVTNVLEDFYSLIEPIQLHEPGRTHILIYTFGENYSDFEGYSSSFIERNSGPFWEPGGFGVFLILAIMFEFLMGNSLFTKRNIVFMIGTLTTLSTGTFVVLFVLMTCYLLIYHDYKKVLVLLSLLVGGFFIYTNTFFLKEKVENQSISKQSVSLRYAPRTRFVSAQLDLLDFMNYPILGRGRYAATRFDINEKDEDLQLNHRNNGTTNLLVEFGAIGFIGFFAFMFKSFRLACKTYQFKKIFAVVFVLVVMLLGFSQMLFLKPFFIGLSFFFFPAYQSVRNLQNDNI